MSFTNCNHVPSVKLFRSPSDQKSLLLRTPQMLSSLLAISLSHNWLTTTVHIMRMHAYLAQALIPGSDELYQLPSIAPQVTGPQAKTVDTKPSPAEIRKAADHLGRLDVTDAYFKGACAVQLQRY